MKKLMVLFILFFATIPLKADQFWPMNVGNEWIYETQYPDTFFSFYIINNSGNSFGFGVRIPPLCSSLPIINPRPIVYLQTDTVKVWHPYGLIADFAIAQDDSFYNEYAYRWTRLISRDSMIEVPAGAFEHCLVYDDSICYAPNIGPLQKRYFFILYEHGFGIQIGGLYSPLHNLVYAKVNGIEYGTNPTSIEYVKEQVPAIFTLHQNYPNPFNGATEIDFDLQESAELTYPSCELHL